MDRTQAFTPDTYFDTSAIAAKVGRHSRTIRNWRTSGLLPPPDVLLGGRDPAWLGSTLNASPAFAPPADIAERTT